MQPSKKAAQGGKLEIKTHKSRAFSHLNVGKLSQFIKNREGDNSAKLFLRDQLGLTGMEVSITGYPPDYAIPFFHSHKQNEELYIILGGEGKMQMDDEVIDVKEGSVVRVLPEVSRYLKSAPDSELLFICIQAKEGSLEQSNRGDGVRQEREPLFS